MTTIKTQQGNYAPINGLDLYYEIHGSGPPLVLLSGAYRTIEAMGAIMPALAATRQVIGVEVQGHGHTADIERPLRYEFMADDVAALIHYLHLACIIHEGEMRGPVGPKGLEQDDCWRGAAAHG